MSSEVTRAERFKKPVPRDNGSWTFQNQFHGVIEAGHFRISPVEWWGLYVSKKSVSWGDECCMFQKISLI